MRTLALLPVKSFWQAKQRLRDGLSPDRRRGLAEAMFVDVLTSLRQSELIAEILVVTAGDTAVEIAHAHGARVVEDGGRGHNAAAELGIEAALRLGAERALLVPGDCPALDSTELDELLARPVEPPCALVVPDRHGTGTNALLLTPPGTIAPSFGPDSCERHVAIARAAGVRVQVAHVPSLALDVDTPGDLEVLESAIGADSDAAPRTRELLSELSAC